MTRITLKAESAAYGGLSIGRWRGKIVFIKGALPGETIEAIIEEEKKDYYKAAVSCILEQSPHRTAPECGFFGICGGCQMQYASYPAQIAGKEEVLGDCLRRLAGLEIGLDPALFHADPWRYRRRGQFKAGQGGTGFYKEKTREIVDIDRCPLMADEINNSFQKLKAFMGEDPVRFHGINEIHITSGDSALALVKAVSMEKPERNTLASLFLQAGFTGVFIESRDKRTSKHGAHYTTFDLGGLRYTVSPASFFQSHWRLNQAVVRLVGGTLHPLQGKRVLDLYSGAGNFSLPLARDAAEVIAVEENPYTVEDGERNAELNRIANCRFIRSSAESAALKDSIDVLFLDPPRLGLANKVIDKIFALMPERIAYLSCNPSTLARDLRKLSARYEVRSVRMIDFFPQTYHIESLAFLRVR